MKPRVTMKGQMLYRVERVDSRCSRKDDRHIERGRALTIERSKR